MGFLKKLFAWFIGDNEEKPTEDDSVLAPIQAAKEHKKVDERPLSKQIEDDILKNSKAEIILNDMKDLELSSHRFQTLRKDLLHELKKLAPKKRTL